jgi:hypothetical protein
MAALSFQFSREQLEHTRGDSVGKDTTVNSGAIFDFLGESLGNLAFVLALDGAPHPNPEWTWPERALDAIVQAAQPAPAVTHVEILFPPSNKDADMHFSTYIGRTAGFGESFSNQRSFYMGSNSGNWRAIPSAADNASSRLRSECQKHVGTQYSVARYMCAVPPFRALASLVPDNPGNPAHCANLTARCIRSALPELRVEHSGSWYGPTTLTLELSSDAHAAEVRKAIDSTSHHMSLGEEEAVDRAVYTLLHGSNGEILRLEPHVVGDSFLKLARRTVEGGMDDVAKKITHKQLATALLRYSCVE